MRCRHAPRSLRVPGRRQQGARRGDFGVLGAGGGMSELPPKRGGRTALPPPPVAGLRWTGFFPAVAGRGMAALPYRPDRIRRPGPSDGAQAGRFEQEQAQADGSGAIDPAGPCQRQAVESRIGATRLQGLSCRLARSGRTRWPAVETLRNPASGHRPKSHSPRAPARPTRRKMRTWSSCRTRNRPLS